MQMKFSSRLCMSSKSWAMFMALSNLGLGISILIGGSVWMTQNHVADTYKTYFVCGIAVAILSIIAGCILISALVQGKENTVLLYILLEFIIVFILTVFSSLNIYASFSIFMFGLLCSCPFFWMGLYNVYGFYVELTNYNHNAVQAGVDDIACNTHANSLVSFPDKALDTTTV